MSIMNGQCHHRIHHTFKYNDPPDKLTGSSALVQALST